jgi:hypothetical protein
MHSITATFSQFSHASPGADAGRTALLDTVNSGENTVFISNTVHILSQLVDSLIMACGGLLPLLAAATSPASELDIADSTGQSLPIETAAVLLFRFVAIADTFIFSTTLHLHDLEQEKNMNAGGITRQALRLGASLLCLCAYSCICAQCVRSPSATYYCVVSKPTSLHSRQTVLI